MTQNTQEKAKDLAEQIRSLGFAVTIFSVEDLGEYINPWDVEDEMRDAGRKYIEDRKWVENTFYKKTSE